MVDFFLNFIVFSLVIADVFSFIAVIPFILKGFNYDFNNYLAQSNKMIKGVVSSIL